MSGALISASVLNTVVVTLSGETITATPIGEDAHAYLKIDAGDGKVYAKVNTGAYTQIDSATDWIRPADAAPGDYEFRFTGLTGDALAFSTAVEDTWYPLSSGDFILRQTDITTGPGGKSSTFTVEVRKGSSGGAHTSASYTLAADREDV